MAVPVKGLDKWKRKKWYKIIAPRFLGEAELAQVPATDDDHLMNRVLKIPLREITRDMNHTYVNIFLRVHEIVGSKAFTKLIKHEVSREYLGTMVRRRRDALQVVFPAKSADGVEFNVKAMVITLNRVSGQQKTLLRNEARKFIAAKAAGQSFGDFILDTLYGKTSMESFEHLRKLAVPLYRVEVYKTQLKELFDTEQVIAQEGEGAVAPDSKPAEPAAEEKPKLTEEEGGEPEAAEKA
ncbi:hypothetical protein COX86_00970 [Candidatus Micrarchaeota archaeon CG_4_10_14_0_2_um_filter_60_11]|nr:MAG: hypothetical protein COU39_02530 [Candidatus Micrarchaeota archaeon CG10_big_fil_rev_8_21_14_0_10_60_32]PIO01696.1 MAG: hypothetical protein COT58_03790 [Candidatus Micrarchaeota archaeon CG09_land_8_20_14_0_10_60_16]PIZ91195.1 MAG: hypothetical protein COX86_00970 [Candidatus Micrarchaeota archaeon CG_4_10_14_0_2_um_filter_60_11]